MYENKRRKEINYTKLSLVLGVIGIMFIAGFISGSSYIYGTTMPKIDELEYQIGQFQDNQSIASDNNPISSITYFYNDTSLSEIYKEVKDSIVVISGLVKYQTFFNTGYYEVQGSGFIYEVSDEIVTITNNHVVSDVSEIVVTFSNGNSYPAEVIGADPYSDLAILSVDAPIEEFHPLEITSSSYLEVGDPVIAIGSPMGLESTMTTGIVSQIGRTIEESLAGSFPIANIIQTNVAINPGNSGGPLLDYQGDVIGITTAIIEDSEGLGFAVPSNTILKEIESLVKTGSYNEHSWLGISGTDMSYTISQIMKVNVTYGWLIAGISSGSAAQEAGLKGGNERQVINNEWVVIGGDIIVAIDGDRIINGDSLMSYLEANTKPGNIINITVIRDNVQSDIQLNVGTRPAVS